MHTFSSSQGVLHHHSLKFGHQAGSSGTVAEQSTHYLTFEGSKPGTPRKKIFGPEPIAEMTIYSICEHENVPCTTCTITKKPNLKLKTLPKQLLSSLPVAFVVGEQCYITKLL
jgi:hypothetical protein